MKHLTLLILATLITTTLHGQPHRGSIAKVNGLEITYLQPKEGAVSKYQTDSTHHATITLGEKQITIDYQKNTYTTPDHKTHRIPKFCSAPKTRKTTKTTPLTPTDKAGNKTINLLGWNCLTQKQGDHYIYYTQEPGFSATPAPWIAAPRGGAILLITDAKSGQVIYTATVISQRH